MAAGLYSLTGNSAIERGACYSFTFDVNSASGEYPLSGYSVSGFIYRKWDKNLETNWTSEIISESSGVVAMSLTSTPTSELSFDALEHEIYLYPPTGCTVRILYGDIDVIGGTF